MCIYISIYLYPNLQKTVKTIVFVEKTVSPICLTVFRETSDESSRSLLCPIPPLLAGFWDVVLALWPMPPPEPAARPGGDAAREGPPSRHGF